jgi:hypothetical protein
LKACAAALPSGISLAYVNDSYAIHRIRLAAGSGEASGAQPPAK